MLFRFRYWFPFSLELSVNYPWSKFKLQTSLDGCSVIQVKRGWHWGYLQIMWTLDGHRRVIHGFYSFQGECWEWCKTRRSKQVFFLMFLNMTPSVLSLHQCYQTEKKLKETNPLRLNSIRQCWRSYSRDSVKDVNGGYTAMLLTSQQFLTLNLHLKQKGKRKKKHLYLETRSLQNIDKETRQGGSEDIYSKST